MASSAPSTASQPASMAASTEAAERLIEAAQSADRRLFCVLFQRFIPAHVRTRALLTEGAIGDPIFGSVSVQVPLEREEGLLLAAQEGLGDGEAGDGGEGNERGAHAPTPLGMIQQAGRPAGEITSPHKRLQGQQRQQQQVQQFPEASTVDDGAEGQQDYQAPGRDRRTLGAT